MHVAVDDDHRSPIFADCPQGTHDRGGGDGFFEKSFPNSTRRRRIFTVSNAAQHPGFEWFVQIVSDVLVGTQHFWKIWNGAGELPHAVAVPGNDHHQPAIVIGDHLQTASIEWTGGDSGNCPKPGHVGGRMFFLDICKDRMESAQAIVGHVFNLPVDHGHEIGQPAKLGIHGRGCRRRCRFCHRVSSKRFYGQLRIGPFFATVQGPENTGSIGVIFYGTSSLRRVPTTATLRHAPFPNSGDSIHRTNVTQLPAMVNAFL
jgi:hypothetical protein